MPKIYRISTKDNPYNPHTHFSNWMQYDLSHGYNSCDYLGRIAKTSDQLSETEVAKEIERAIDEIIKFDPLGIYIKVLEPTG